MSPTVTKAQVNYGPATGQETIEGHVCGKCTMFLGGGRCTLVFGQIDPQAHCDEFEAK